MNGPLDGLKVVDISEFVSGSYCAKLMADLGAYVIKIERPEKGDIARKWGPFPEDIPNQDKSGLFLYLNANKFGITLNLKRNLGIKIFHKIIKECDVLIESGLKSKKIRIGMHFEILKKINPKLIMTSIAPFGLDGPYKNYKASELTLMHMSGIGYGTPGEISPEELKSEQPIKANVLSVEFMAGMAAATATMFAIIESEEKNVGQQVEISQQEAVTMVGFANLAQFFYAGVNPTRENKGRFPMAPMHMLPCKDGYIHLECLEEHQWSEFVDLIGNPEWACNELFKSRESRAEYWDALEPQLTEITLKWEKADLSKEAQKRNVPCTVVRTANDLLNSEQLKSRGFFTKIEHPIAGSFLYPGAPYKLSKNQWSIKRRAPLLGEHNEEILCGKLGYSKRDLIIMKSMNII